MLFARATAGTAAVLIVILSAARLPALASSLGMAF